MGDRLGDRNKSVVLIGLLENFLQCAGYARAHRLKTQNPKVAEYEFSFLQIFLVRIMEGSSEFTHRLHVQNCY